MKISKPGKRLITGVAATALISLFAFAAATLEPSSQPAWDIAPFGLSTTDIASGNAKAYQPWFENGAWQGDIIEHDIAANGARTHDTGNWTARAIFTIKETNITDYWKASNGRRIITWDGSSQVAFRWDQLTETQQGQLDPATLTAGLNGSYDSEILNYLRGKRDLEQISGGSLRTRYSLLGDIIHSQPVFVGPPSGRYPLAGYAAFKNSQSSRDGRIYVGANDGMIHVFDEDGGNEVYAYVPSMLMPTLSELTVHPYYHSYFADGQLTSGDAKPGGSWKTVLAGGLGAGGKGLFALDVTNPDLSSETSASGNDRKILWEKTGSALGYIHGRPRIAKLPNGNWYVVTGNGYGSDDDEAKLYLASLDDSIADRTIRTLATGNNGLSAPALIDTDHDGDADYAYAGDLLGNLWRFDLSNDSPALKLFAAGSSKPITTAPEITIHPNGGRLIYFGTGSLLSSADAANTDQQSLYAIWDKPGNSSVVLESNLETQTLTADSHSSGTAVRIATTTAVDWSSRDGWKVDLPLSGERLLGNPRLRGQRLQLTTDTPGGESWLMALDWLTGGDPDKIHFDLDDSGALDAGDKVTVSGTPRTPVARSLGTGNFSQPAFGRIAGGTDILLTNGLFLVEPEPCSGVCAGGVAGGHFDLDTDTELGGNTDQHTHQYDDKYNLTYGDYFDLQAGDSLDEIGLPGNKQLVVILANSDLSVGGTLMIGDKQWNVVDYQEMVQQKLADWDGSSPLVDDDGDSLIYTIDGIKATTGGTIKITFSSTAIADGGLMGTNTGCVHGNDAWAETGRWRNGALTLHVLDYDEIKAGNQSNNVWFAQTPIDLADGMVGGGLIGNPDNTAGFLYETTLFWHWKGDLAKKLIGEGGMCYGEDYWAEAWAAETAGLTKEAFAQLFPDKADNYDAIVDLITQANNYTCDKGVGADCEKEDGYKDIDNQLKDLFDKNWKDYRNAFGKGGGVPTGEPVDTEDRAQDFTPVLGPNFTLGRRAWIDL